jgi:hypothetical protein
VGFLFDSFKYKRYNLFIFTPTQQGQMQESIELKTPKQEWNEGLSQESRVFRWLESRSLTVQPSTKEQNVYHDIDAWVNNKATSIKSPRVESVTRYRRIPLELQTQYSDGSWLDSWFRYGKSEVYVFLIGSSLYTAWAAVLKRFYERNKRCNMVVRHRTLSRETKQKQQELAHKHVDALTANVSLDLLLQSQVLTYKAELSHTS